MQDIVKYDIVILGTGPAGLQAAIHAERRKVCVLLLGKQTKRKIKSKRIGIPQGKAGVERDFKGWGAGTCSIRLSEKHNIETTVL